MPVRIETATSRSARLRGIRPQDSEIDRLLAVLGRQRVRQRMDRRLLRP